MCDSDTTDFPIESSVAESSATPMHMPLIERANWQNRPLLREKYCYFIPSLKDFVYLCP